MTIKEFAEKLKEQLESRISFRQFEKQNAEDESTADACTAQINAFVNCIIDINQLVEQADQERTNFEKWRDNREPSDYVSQIIEWNYDSDSCTSCPFVGKYDCPRIKHKDECRCIEASECWEVLMEWANKRVEE